MPGGRQLPPVLTDRDFFQGQEGDLLAARSACSLPVLRKTSPSIPGNFMKRGFGGRLRAADCRGARSTHLKPSMRKQSLGLDVLVEVHDAEELIEPLSLSPSF